VDRVEAELEVVVVVVDAVPSHLQHHAVGLRPAAGRGAHDGGRVYEACADRLGWNCERDGREAALELGGVGVVGELLALDVNLVATLDRAHVGEDVGHDRLLVVRECEASAAPVHSVHAHLEGKLCSDVSVGW